MEQQTPIPPKSRMKAREGQKRTIFPSLIWGGGGGLGFSFILSKIVVLGSQSGRELAETQPRVSQQGKGMSQKVKTGGRGRIPLLGCHICRFFGM